MELQKLTPNEIKELNTYAAQRILAENSNILVELEDELFVALRELGEARIKVEQIKNKKATIIEQNRALKAVIQGG